MRRLSLVLLAALTLTWAGGCFPDDFITDGGTGGGMGGGGGGYDPSKGRVSGKLTLFQGAQSAKPRLVSATEREILAAVRRSLETRTRAAFVSGALLPPPLVCSSSTPVLTDHPVKYGPVAPPEYRAGEIIVRFAEKVTAAAAQKQLARPGLVATHLGFASEYLHLLRYDDARTRRPLAVAQTLELARGLGRLPGVRFTEVNSMQHATAVPNDPGYAKQWHYPAMNLPAAWDITQGSNAVVVSVVDTGIINHPDLNARVLTGIDMITDPAISNDGDGRDDDPSDPGGDDPNGGSSFHGTHCAGTVGAVTDNGQGISGVDWNARLLPVRVLGKGGGTLFDIASGMQWAIGGAVPGARTNSTPARVVSLSLGGNGDPSPTYQDVIDLAPPGVVFVIAAGNENENTAQKRPCNQSNVICVGATRFSGLRASYSNFGAQVTIMAPGGEVAEDQNGDGDPDGVLSTLQSSGQPSYVWYQGTSMATPHVAGLVALMKSVNANITQAQATTILKNTANSQLQCSEGCGSGLVNAQAAVLSAKGQTASGPAKLSVASTDLFFTAANNKAQLTVANTGGQPLNVTASTSGTAAANVGFPAGSQLTVAAGQTASLAVEVNLAGLAAGTTSATIGLASNGGSASINVRIQVGGANDKVAVLALAYQDNAGDWQAGGGGDVLPQNDYRYVFEAPPREYFVVAGVDENGNGKFFEDGERGGFFPTLDQPDTVIVTAGQEIKNVNFTLAPLRDTGGSGLVVGASCSGAPDCPDNGFCETSWPGGYCSRNCDTQSCPGSSRCYAVGANGTKACLSTCTGPSTGQSDCRVDYRCYSDGTGGGACLPACTSNNDCEQGVTCDLGTGYCG